MDYKSSLNKQIMTLETLQESNIASGNIDITAKTENAVKIAEEINRLAAHAKEILTPNR
jgi:hypothetical protein